MWRCGCALAECLADVPAEVHQVNAFECRVNRYGRYLTRGVAQTIFGNIPTKSVKFRFAHIGDHCLLGVVEYTLQLRLRCMLLLGNSIGTQNLVLRWQWGNLRNNDLLDSLDNDSGSFGNNCHLLQFLKCRKAYQEFLHLGQQQHVKCYLQTDIECRQHNHRCEESNRCTKLIIPLTSTNFRANTPKSNIAPNTKT